MRFKIPYHLGLAAGALTLAACSGSETPTSPSASPLRQVWGPSASSGTTTETPPPKSVLVCKNGPAGTTATFSVATSGGGVLLQGTEVTIDANPAADGTGCVEVWRGTDLAYVGWTVTVTEVSASPNTTLAGISLLNDLGTVNFAPPTNSVTADVNYYHGAVITFTNVATPPPPPPVGCVGLTPGYWKNWRNHYTSAQFLQLLQGTIAPTISQADALFADKSSSAIVKLRWFVLANQLTLNLTGTSLPNPSAGNLTPVCTLPLGGQALGDALATGLNILNGVGGPYSESYIDSIKTILDTFANLE